MAEKKVTDKQIIEALTSGEYATLGKMADALGISRITLYRRMVKSEYIQEAINSIADAGINAGVNRMFKIIEGKEGHPQDAISALKLVMQYRGKLSDKVNIAGPNGEPLQITYVVENGNTGKTE
jgi:uncharacterized protein YqgV (UPF0045/DUF77 family)